ncbi:MAG: response regulator [Acidimicrobiia bacterium]|nr:response regulator [Acidimicrobiia bacterium]
MSAQKILIVEDDDATQKGLTMLLRGDGFHVSSAPDAIAAMVSVRRINPDLVILDLGLPAGDGFSLLESIKAHRPYDPIPTIVLTGRDRKSNEQRATTAGAVAFFQKPADHEELLWTIRRHIGQKRATLKKVLIIEDDPDTQKGLATLLKAEGFVANFASDGATALSVASREEPDVILLDLGLPAGDGFIVLDRLKRHPTLNSVPVIVVSARDAEANRPKALQAGADAYFQKPADFEALLKAVRSALGED